MHILYENVTKYNLESSPLLTELLIRWYLSPPIVVRHRVYPVVTFSHIAFSFLPPIVLLSSDIWLSH